ncbi:hypothetical protein [Cryptosporangium phraense]|uniref:Uncharacterized protein n=1 Tax=Cryptosporangium phraense TaxID=2593070 RepID=A0A545AI50_9ACTN|nr:hypothetical protein [Cryptosporangium phraense]TQS40997.1 hypothetical protein FL583_31980 [Cryptosporangium phraense]
MAYPVDSRQLRPRRVWYVVAVLIAVLFTAVGVGAFALGVVSAVKSIPDFTRTAQSGEIDLQPGVYGIFVPEGSSTSCSYGDGITATTPGGTFTFTRDGSSWTWASTITVEKAGTYSIKCDAGRYALGGKPELGMFAGSVAGGIAALAGLPCLGITIGGIIALVVGLRRSSHKKRLQAYRY